MSIPLVDLKAQHQQVQEEVAEGWKQVLDNTSFVLGQEVERFENEFAAFTGVSHCVGVANGTDALELALRAVGLRAGQEVVLPANTFIASALAVVRAGGVPVLVDVDPVYQLMDVDLAMERVGEGTGAVMPVHLFGQVVPGIGRLVSEARAQGVPVVEDAAQAQGATAEGITAGRFGLAAGTSFYPGKNLGAYGDAGAVVTDDPDVAEALRALRNYGSDVKYHHPVIGFNSRLDTLQAVVLSAKLRRLATWNESRRAAAGRYAALLADVDDVLLPSTAPGNAHIWHLYVVRVPNRDRVLEALHRAGVGAGVHYPVPIHLQGAFSSLGHGVGSFPVTEQLAAEILSLPLFAEITPDQQEQVAEALQKALH